MNAVKFAIEKGINLLKSEITIGSLIGNVCFLRNFLTSEPTTCFIINKLEDTSNKLKKLSESIRTLENAIRCQELETFLDEISFKIFSLQSKLIAFQKGQVDREELRSLYNNVDEQGMHYILSKFQAFFFKEQKFSNTVLKWALCRSTLIDVFRKYIRCLYVTIVINLKIHEELNKEINPDWSDFEFQRFENYFNKTWKYYDSYVIPNHFRNGIEQENRRNGFKKIINEKNQSASEIAKELKRLYNFFDWDVIIYPKKYGFDKHCIKSSVNSYFCSGSEFFLRELNNEYCGLIAWRLPEQINNEDIVTGHFSDNAQQNTEEIWKRNTNLSYVLTIQLSFDLPLDDLKFPDSHGKFKHYCYYKLPDIAKPNNFLGLLLVLFLIVNKKGYNPRVCSYSSRQGNLLHHPKPEEEIFNVGLLR